MILRFLLSLPVWFVCTFILTWFVVPIGVVMADGDGRLPRVFRWWETHDNLGYSGLDQERDVKEFAKKWGNRIGLIRWLYRNKAYTLRYRLGIPFHDSDRLTWRVLSAKGSVWDNGPFWLWAYVEVAGKRYFEFQPGFAIGGRRLYVRIGWKVAPLVSAKDYPTGSTGMFTGITPRLKR